MSYLNIIKDLRSLPGPITIPRLASQLRPKTSDELEYLHEDWDIMILLDACRYDTLAAEHADRELPGSVRAERSPATTTAVWVDKTFGGAGELHDVVYLDANGRYSIVDTESSLHAYIPAWTTDDAGSDSPNIVPPDGMADTLVKTANDYPNKRILAHFVQPHTPFLGEGAIDIPRGPNARTLVRDHGISRTALNDAYRENLSLALDEVERILDDLNGTVVLTSDHGELLGERLWPLPARDYGHPYSVEHPVLRTVPWYEIDCGHREIVADPPDEQPDMNANADLNKHLAALGYR